MIWLVWIMDGANTRELAGAFTEPKLAMDLRDSDQLKGKMASVRPVPLNKYLLGWRMPNAETDGRKEGD
jgi:hypothetical protein